MLEGLPASLLANAGAVGVLAVAVLGILRGWLVPGRSLDQMLDLHQKRLEEEKARGDEWRQVANLAIKRADERDKQTERLLEVIDSTAGVMMAVQKALEAPATQRAARGRG